VLIQNLIVLAPIAGSVEGAQALYVVFRILTASGAADSRGALVALDGTIPASPSRLANTGVGLLRLALQADALVLARSLGAGPTIGDALLELGLPDQLHGASLQGQTADAAHEARLLANGLGGQELPVGHSANVQVLDQFQLGYLLVLGGGERHRMLFIHLDVSVPLEATHAYRVPLIQRQWLLRSHQQRFTTEIKPELRITILQR